MRLFDDVLYQHNMYCPLKLPKNNKHKVFTSMIKGLREYVLVEAITTNPKIHSLWIEEFWKNAKGVKDTS